jgi:predicted transcriptional regulator
MRIPKFKTEAKEADWCCEHRDELAYYFLEVMRNKRQSLEAELVETLRTPTIAIAPKELKGRSMVSVLRGELGKPGLGRP